MDETFMFLFPVPLSAPDFGWLLRKLFPCKLELMHLSSLAFLMNASASCKLFNILHVNGCDRCRYFAMYG